jgi:hypothetical protein
MKYLAPEAGGMIEASVFDTHALIIAAAILVVVGIVVVTLSVLFRRRRAASAAGEGMSPGRMAFKIILLAAVAVSLACYLLLDKGELEGVLAFLTGEPCCPQEEQQECCSPEDAQPCCPEAEAEETTHSQSESTSPGLDAKQAGLAGEAEEQ